MQGCKPTSKDQAYKANVSTFLEYALTVFDSYIKQYIDSIEMVQRRTDRSKIKKIKVKTHRDVQDMGMSRYQVANM